MSERTGAKTMTTTQQQQYERMLAIAKRDALDVVAHGTPTEEPSTPFPAGATRTPGTSSLSRGRISSAIAPPGSMAAIAAIGP
jgi:hypothetical protein